MKKSFFFATVLLATTSFSASAEKMDFDLDLTDNSQWTTDVRTKDYHQSIVKMTGDNLPMAEAGVFSVKTENFGEMEFSKTVLEHTKNHQVAFVTTAKGYSLKSGDTNLQEVEVIAGYVTSRVVNSQVTFKTMAVVATRNGVVGNNGYSVGYSTSGAKVYAGFDFTPDDTRKISTYVETASFNTVDKNDNTSDIVVGVNYDVSF